ncbi:thioesterase family protein [Pelotomaculum propionicicum]|uniref:Fluoroacetyl-CoA thioesterase n=1 Tax=Pelotomaculum propionicicum TaxID=258475 RepID=A0A4Y7RJI4_9FIRM|nr:thioesterase family protein [Pelotomaculum propionicicum]TEB08971.1 Fluoroacetyl-CoA thioesterase [Pelotomaculum propionicicum]
MAKELEVGIKGEARDAVTDLNTAVAYGNTVVNVYASPAMIGLMEKAALTSVLPYLGEGMTTVGTRFEVKHLAATPVGLSVTARSTLVEIEGKRLLFEVEAWDDTEQIGKGIHERFIVKLEGFLKRAQGKSTGGQA